MAVYLIHFDQPFHHANHYLGFVDTDRYPLAEALATRVDFHRRGAGSRLLRAVKAAGIDWQVVRVWPEGTRTNERRLKGHSGTRYCPLCNPAWETNGRLTGSIAGVALAAMI